MFQLIKPSSGPYKGS